MTYMYVYVCMYVSYGNPFIRELIHTCNKTGDIELLV